MDADEDDFVFFGTPIEREEEITSRKKKAVAEASGNLRSLAPWKQEVTDEEGRRRFHGAFTGGFSAGYYNTVGSKEGWTPQSFTSSRKSRAEVKQQNILNFLDEDERAELDGRSLGTSSQFDTFGLTAVELARKQAEKEQQKRPSAIPGPVPTELVVPAAESIGEKLLRKMGWKPGRAIKNSRANSLYDARREARKALLAFSSDGKAVTTDFESAQGNMENLAEPDNDDVQSSQSTPVYVLNPKMDLYGLGFDPYKHAPEFREKKRSRISGNKELSKKPLSIKDSLFGFKAQKVGPGFGIGALEEPDAEDEDVYASGYDFEERYVQEVEEPSRSTVDSRLRLTGKEQGVLNGFKVASNSENRLERFDPPEIPKDFVPRHKFSGPLDDGYNLSEPPPEVTPPEDNNLKILIEGVASLVARCGKLFEDISREKNQSNPLFSFLTGGSGHDFYARRLWEERQKRNDQCKQHVDWKLSPGAQKMTAESRGKILGERPLEKSTKDSGKSITSADVQIQFNLTDTFTQPASSSQMLEVAKPFKDDPAKQERFEQFIKEKYRGGLRSTDSGGAGHMSEASRARERLDFEAAAEAIEKGKWGKESKLSMQHFMEFPAAGGMRFTSGGLEEVKDSKADEAIMKMYPRREEYQWRPSSILCKRFDLIDPYLGKLPPAPRMKSKMDSFVFMSDVVKATEAEEKTATDRDAYPVPQSAAEETGKDVVEVETKFEGEMDNLERPVDLYKAIFSDDSDDEENKSSPKKGADPENNVKAANTTLNRLIAGDFLESLGKELGLEVPPDVPPVTNKPLASQKDAINMNTGDPSTHPVSRKPMSSTNALSEPSLDQGMLPHREIHQESGNGRKYREHDLSQNKSGKVNPENVTQKYMKAKGRNQSSSSSPEDRSRKRSRHHKYRNGNSDSASSGDRDQYRSRSKGRKKGSSQKKSSRHQQYRNGDSDSDSSSDGERYHSSSKGRKKGSSKGKSRSSSRRSSKHRKHE